jgi:hypothetical protein
MSRNIFLFHQADKFAPLFLATLFPKRAALFFPNAASEIFSRKECEPVYFFGRLAETRPRLLQIGAKSQILFKGDGLGYFLDRFSTNFSTELLKSFSGGFNRRRRAGEINLRNQNPNCTQHFGVGSGAASPRSQFAQSAYYGLAGGCGVALGAGGVAVGAEGRGASGALKY